MLRGHEPRGAFELQPKGEMKLSETANEWVKLKASDGHELDA